MKTIIAALAVGMLLFSTAGGTFAAPHKAASPDVTLTGEIVDLACYIAHGGQGTSHADCAAKCAAMGQPIGLKAADGKVYLLVADHADTSAFTKAKSMAGKNVEITGEVAAKDGINALTVHAVKTV